MGDNFDSFHNEKKMMGKNEMIAIIKLGWIGCQGFWVKYYPKRSEVWRFYPKPAGLDLENRVGGLVESQIIFAFIFIFYIALSKKNPNTFRYQDLINKR